MEIVQWEASRCPIASGRQTTTVKRSNTTMTGGEQHHDGGEAHKERGQASWDAFVELTGEWEGRQRISGEIEDESGGKSLWLSPGARFSSTSGFSVAASLGLPIWQGLRASHPDNDYRMTLAIGKTF